MTAKSLRTGKEKDQRDGQERIQMQQKTLTAAPLVSGHCRHGPRLSSGALSTLSSAPAHPKQHRKVWEKALPHNHTSQVTAHNPFLQYLRKNLHLQPKRADSTAKRAWPWACSLFSEIISIRKLKGSSAQSVNSGHLTHAVNEKAGVRDFEGRQGDQKHFSPTTERFPIPRRPPQSLSKPPLPRRAGGRLHVGNSQIN